MGYKCINILSLITSYQKVVSNRIYINCNTLAEFINFLYALNFNYTQLDNYLIPRYKHEPKHLQEIIRYRLIFFDGLHDASGRTRNSPLLSLTLRLSE